MFVSQFTMGTVFGVPEPIRCPGRALKMATTTTRHEMEPFCLDPLEKQRMEEEEEDNNHNHNNDDCSNSLQRSFRLNCPRVAAFGLLLQLLLILSLIYFWHLKIIKDVSFQDTMPGRTIPLEVVNTPNNATTTTICNETVEDPSSVAPSRPNSPLLNPALDRPPPIDRAWCPTAVCSNSPICRPCQRRFLMVITNGRSASTTLTWMLDSLPGVRMGGENNDALQNIKDMMNQTFHGAMKTRPTSTSKNSPWYHNPIPAGALACVSQKMIETVVPPPLLINDTQLPPKEEQEIIGFKTIRLFQRTPMTQMPEMVSFLQEHFPCTRYIVNYRSNLQAQAESQTTTFKKDMADRDQLDKVVNRLDSEVQWLIRFAELMGKDQATIIDSSIWTEDVSQLNKAVQWLGFDESCAFEKILELNTKNGYGSEGPKTLEMNPRCRYVGGGKYRR